MMSRQDYYREKYRKRLSSWQDSQTIYVNLIDQLINKETKVLDIGCGHSDLLKKVYSKSAFTYGLDPDKRALEQNKIINHKISGTAEKIPMAGNFFDLVVSLWVLEHLKEPIKAFEEIHRVLKPNGKVIFLTPNIYNYNIWFTRLIPGIFHDFLTRWLYQRQEHDTFKKFYRINSVKKIDETLTPLGFKKEKLILNGDPSYISFNNFLFNLACFSEKIIDNYFPLAKVHLIGVYKKY